MSTSSTSSSSSPSAPPPPPPAAARLMQIASAFVFSKALAEVAALDVANAIKSAGAPQTAEQLVAAYQKSIEAGSDPSSRGDSAPLAPYLHRALRALSAIGVFEESPGPNGEQRFALTELSEILTDGHPSNVKSIITHLGRQPCFQLWAAFGDVIRQGKGAHSILWNHPSPFEWFQEHPREEYTFQKAMKESLQSTIAAISKAEDFRRGFKRIVDVGGSLGHLLRGLLELPGNEATRGAVFDLPRIADASREAAKGDPILGDPARVEFVGGDFFQEVPKSNCFVISRVLHDWPDEKATAILKNLGAALEGGDAGRVFIVDCVLPDFGSAPSPQSPMKCFMDLHMMVVCSAKERSAKEFEQLLASAGLELVRIIPLHGEPTSIVEAKKKQ